MLPLLGWAAVAVTSAIVATVLSDSSNTESHDVSNRKEKEDEALDTALSERNQKITKDIRQYKKKQRIRFSDKYGVDIEFVPDSSLDKSDYQSFFGVASVAALSGGFLDAKHSQCKIRIKQSNNASCLNLIKSLEENNQKLMQLIAQLEESKNESVV